MTGPVAPLTPGQIVEAATIVSPLILHVQGPYTIPERNAMALLLRGALELAGQARPAGAVKASPRWGALLVSISKTAFAAMCVAVVLGAASGLGVLIYRSITH